MKSATLKPQLSPAHFGNLIRKIVDEKGMTKSEFARRISTSPQNIYGIFKRKSIDTDTLFKCSVALQYDFAQHLSTNNMNTGDQVITAAELKHQLEATTKQLQQCQRENGYLKEINELRRTKDEKLKSRTEASKKK